MLSNTQEYALRAMTQLAREAPASATTADIAKAARVPGSYLAKIMQDLRRAGLVNSQRGVGGGVSLAKPAKKNHAPGRG
jgi:Rrf2 family protein